MNSTLFMNSTVHMNSNSIYEQCRTHEQYRMYEQYHTYKIVIVFPGVELYVQFQLAISCLQEFGLIFYSSIFINIKSFLQYHVYSSIFYQYHVFSSISCIFINIMSFHQYHVYSSISCIFIKIKIYWGCVWKEMNLPLLISEIGLPIRSFSPNSQRPLYLFPSFLPLCLFLLSLSLSFFLSLSLPLSPLLFLSLLSLFCVLRREGREMLLQEMRGEGQVRSQAGQVKQEKERKYIYIYIYIIFYIILKIGFQTSFSESNENLPIAPSHHSKINGVNLMSI